METLNSTNVASSFPSSVPLSNPIYHKLTEPWVISAAIAFTASVMWLQKFLEKEKIPVPTVTFFSSLVPRFFSRMLFNSRAPTVIYNGYKKFKGSPYRILRPTGELIVIPNKYSEELRALPSNKLNALEATFENHVGSYTTILTGSHLHTDTIQKALTPALTRVIPRLVDELRYAFDTDFPKCDDKWVPVKPYGLILELVARAGSRVFLGPSLCRNAAWHDASMTFTSNIFETVALMRPFPSFLHPVVALFLPSVWRLRSQLKVIKALIVPEIEARRAAQSAGDSSYKKPDDFLQWMMDLAKPGPDSEAGNLAHRMLGIQSMAVVHTSAMAAVHVMYDLMEHPEHLEPLTEEAREALKGGWENAGQSELIALKKLDSFLKESQRWNPPGHLSFHRIVKQDMTLSDGLHLPAGTHICMPSGPISMDPAIVSDADRFDGFRWFREDKASASFVSMGPTNLHFGLGRFACPGRFFAAYVIKAILSKILLDYEFRYDENRKGGRPTNILIGDKVVPDVYTDVYFRRKQTVA